MKNTILLAGLVACSLGAGLGSWIALSPASAPASAPAPAQSAAIAPTPEQLERLDPMALPPKTPTPGQLARLAPAADSARALLALLGADPSWTRLDFTADGDARFLRTPQWASVDWSRGLCLARVDPDLAFGGPNPELGARLGASTAAAGCALRARPRLGWRDAGYKGSAPDGLLDELWATDAAMMGDSQRYNWFRIGANGYAEAAAAGHAAMDGLAPAEISRSFDNLQSASFAGEQSSDPARSTAWMLAGSWRSKGWSLDRAARAAGARRALGFGGFALVAKLAPREISKIVASSWCQWQRAEEGGEVAYQGASSLLGTIHRDKERRAASAAAQSRSTGSSASALAQASSSNWSSPFPELAMPAFAVNKLQWESSPRMSRGETLHDVSDAEAASCVDSALALLAARYGERALAPR